MISGCEWYIAQSLVDSRKHQVMASKFCYYGHIRITMWINEYKIQFGINNYCFASQIQETYNVGLILFIAKSFTSNCIEHSYYIFIVPLKCYCFNLILCILASVPSGVCWSGVIVQTYSLLMVASSWRCLLFVLWFATRSMDMKTM